MSFSKQYMGLFVAMCFLAGASPASRAALQDVRIAQQYGISFLPLMIIEHDKLLEKHARAAGLGDSKVSVMKLAGGGPMNDALLSGNLQFASVGLPPLIIMWAKTQGSLDVKGVSGMCN